MDSGERGWGNPAVFDSASPAVEHQDGGYDADDHGSPVAAPEHAPDAPGEGGGELDAGESPTPDVETWPEPVTPSMDEAHEDEGSGEHERWGVDSPTVLHPDTAPSTAEVADQADDAGRSEETSPVSTDDPPPDDTSRGFEPATAPEIPAPMPDGDEDPDALGSTEADAAEPGSPTDPGGQAGMASSARRPPRPLPRTLAIANQKGGVGKTTTAVNLGAGLAALGYRVLVVDLDPQGNATTGLGVDARNLSASVYDVLLADRPLEDAVEPTAVRNLFVVPATLDLAGAEIELVPAFSRELKLRRAVDGLDGQFDFTLIDCPPSLGLLTVNGLAAADEVLVPVQCEYYALEGLGQLLRNIQLVQSNLNPRLELSTIVLTMYDARTKLSDQVASEVRSHFGPRVCRNIVPRSVRLSEAPSFGQPIIVFDPTSRGAIAYRELAKEVSGGAPRRSG